MLAAGKKHLSHHKSASYAPCEVKWKMSKVPYRTHLGLSPCKQNDVSMSVNTP